MLVELGTQGKNIYREYFEDWFLKETEAFYKSESNRYISENSCPDYLKKWTDRLLQENKRVYEYLHESTLERVGWLLDQEWIAEHHQTLIQKPENGCEAMFSRNDDHNHEDL